jgi:hypothetical protein
MAAAKPDVPVDARVLADFLMIGVGASATGLTAFFSGIRADIGPNTAFERVRHLVRSPTLREINFNCTITTNERLIGKDPR